MASNRKQVPRQNYQQAENRLSQQFVYNPDFQKHIGKRTGNRYDRVYPKQNYDGFPRFSQYQSHRNTQSSSLAKQLQNTSNLSVQIRIDTHQSEHKNLQQPFQSKQSPIIQATPLQPIINNNSSSRMSNGPLPGFNFGVNIINNTQISTIKRRNSTARPSQLKTYRDILNDLEHDQFKQFIFDEKQIEYISESAKKQKQQLQQVKQKIKIKQKQSLEDRKSKDFRKKKNQNRVSFKQNNTQIYITSDSKDSQKQRQEAMHKKQAEQHKHDNQTQLIIQKHETKVITKQTQYKQPQTQQQNYKSQQDAYYSEQNQIKLKNQNEKKAKMNYYQNNDDHPSSNINNKYQQQQQVFKVENKRNKRQVRVTDNPEKYQQAQSSPQTRNNEQKKQNKIKNQKKPIKVKKVSNQGKNNNKRNKNIAVQLVVSKIRSRSQQNEYIQQLTTESTTQFNERYPKRLRIKPVQYWQNQKVHYKAGRAMSIEGAQIKLKQILCTNQNFQHKINVNFCSHDVQIQIIIPGKQILQSNGFKEPYDTLQIQLNSKKNEQQSIYFEDGIRSLKITKQQVIQVQRYKCFQILNKQKHQIKVIFTLKIVPK